MVVAADVDVAVAVCSLVLILVHHAPYKQVWFSGLCALRSQSPARRLFCCVSTLFLCSRSIESYLPFELLRRS